MHFVGIDWADQHHDICVLAEDGRVVTRPKIQNDLTGFQQLNAVLRSLAPVRVSIERPDGLLVDYLLEQGWDLYMIPPRATAAKRGRRAKHDQRDAQLLANLLRTDDPECRPLSRSTPLVLHLKHKVRTFDQLQQDRQRYTNRLVHALKLYYPVMIGLFRYIYQPMTLDFLQRFPDPQSLQDLSLPEFTAFFDGRRYSSRDKIPAMYAKLQAPAPAAADVEGCRFNMLNQVTLLQAINNQLLPLEKEITQRFKQHPEADWWAHFPGVGPLTAARLLVYVGDNRQRFPSYQILQATAGTVPITQQSGRRSKAMFRNECSKPLRRTVTDWARNSLKSSAWAKAYYAQQRARGHEYERCYRALANRWVRVFWTLWQSGDYYDAKIHEGHSRLLNKKVVSLGQAERAS